MTKLDRQKRELLKRATNQLCLLQRRLLLKKITILEDELCYNVTPLEKPILDDGWKQFKPGPLRMTFSILYQEI